jgi:hypothetical protein
VNLAPSQLLDKAADMENRDKPGFHNRHILDRPSTDQPVIPKDCPASIIYHAPPDSANRLRDMGKLRGCGNFSLYRVFVNRRQFAEVKNLSASRAGSSSSGVMMPCR